LTIKPSGFFDVPGDRHGCDRLAGSVCKRHIDVEGCLAVRLQPRAQRRPGASKSFAAAVIKPLAMCAYRIFASLATARLLKICDANAPAIAAPDAAWLIVKSALAC
jgi:hypothetical protein